MALLGRSEGGGLVASNSLGGDCQARSVQEPPDVEGGCDPLRLRSGRFDTVECLSVLYDFTNNKISRYENLPIKINRYSLIL